MKITELKDWGKLTPEEQARLRDVYQVDKDDNLPPSYVETSDQTPPNKPITDVKDDSNIIINAESVVVHEIEKKEDHG